MIKKYVISYVDKEKKENIKNIKELKGKLIRKELIVEEYERNHKEIINRNITPKYIDFNQIKVQIREELSRYLFHETECKPMIIAVVQEV